VTPIPREGLRPLSDEDTYADGQPAVPVTGTLQDALAALLGSDSGRVVVRDGDRPIGALTPDDIHRALHDEAGSPY
jgi:CBS domain-containing protein